jgi:hypothetical protein
MCNTIKKLRNKFRKLIRRIQWYWFVKTNTSKVLNVLTKYDPCSLLCYKNNQLLNPDEYSNETDDLLNMIRFYGGIKEVDIIILNNLLYLVFIENHIVLMNLEDGCPTIQSIKELQKYIGTKDRYLPIAEEIYKLLS